MTPLSVSINWSSVAIPDFPHQWISWFPPTAATSSYPSGDQQLVVVICASQYNTPLALSLSQKYIFKRIKALCQNPQISWLFNHVNHFIISIFVKTDGNLTDKIYTRCQLPISETLFLHKSFIQLTGSLIYPILCFFLSHIGILPIEGSQTFEIIYPCTHVVIHRTNDHVLATWSHHIWNK